MVCIKKYCIALAALVLIGPALAARDDGRWPQVPVPQQVATFDVGQEVVVNGTRTRIRGFVSHADPAVLVASFRKLLGQPLMENRRGNKIILGRAEGPYYVTVQLDPLGAGTRGVVAVSKPPVDREEPVDAAAARRLLSALPPGSNLASHTSSIDGTVHASHDAIVNDHSIGINREYVQRMLTADGFILERESSPQNTTRTHSHLTSNARTLFFKRPSAEAIAVLFSGGDGKSFIILNRIDFTGSAK